MTNKYELLFLIPGNNTDQEVVPIKEKIQKMVEKAGGAVSGDETLGKRKLAYPINKQHYGYYQLLEFDLDGEQIKKLNNDLKLTDELMRHTIVKRDEKAPSFREQTRQQYQAQQKREERAKIAEREKQAVEQPSDAKDKKVKIEDLDQKLDEILEGEIL